MALEKLTLTNRLIPEWKRVWKMYSTHALSIAGAIPVAWASMSPDWQHSCRWMLWALAPAVALSGIVGRVVKQASVSGNNSEAQDSQATPQP
jgi:hypothetical protein